VEQAVEAFELGGQLEHLKPVLASVHAFLELIELGEAKGETSVLEVASRASKFTLESIGLVAQLSALPLGEHVEEKVKEFREGVGGVADLIEGLTTLASAVKTLNDSRITGDERDAAVGNLVLGLLKITKGVAALIARSAAERPGGTAVVAGAEGVGAGCIALAALLHWYAWGVQTNVETNRRAVQQAAEFAFCAGYAEMLTAWTSGAGEQADPPSFDPLPLGAWESALGKAVALEHAGQTIEAGDIGRSAGQAAAWDAINTWIASTPGYDGSEAKWAEARSRLAAAHRRKYGDASVRTAVYREILHSAATGERLVDLIKLARELPGRSIGSGS
jgi:hypothetical protein